MKLFAEYKGDPSVGIWNVTQIIDIPELQSFDDKEQREHIREAAKNLAAAIWGEDTLGGVQFEDECSDCGSTECSGSCTLYEGELDYSDFKS